MSMACQSVHANGAAMVIAVVFLVVFGVFWWIVVTKTNSGDK